MSEIIISNVQRKDDGLYECQARNKGGQFFKSGHIQVNQKEGHGSVPSDQGEKVKGPRRRRRRRTVEETLCPSNQPCRKFWGEWGTEWDWEERPTRWEREL